MDKKFEYTYSAATEEERGEIENIRSRYIQREEVESGLEKLRRLDRQVKNPPLICALALGIAGVLIFGLGLTFFLEWDNYAAGAVISVVGCALMAANPFIYKKFLSLKKKKFARAIVALSDELLGSDKNIEKTNEKTK